MTESLENKVKIEMKKIEKTLVIPDFHAPYEDYQALHAVYKYAKDSKPDKVILLGDCVDFYAISKFSRNPERVTGLQHEIDVVRYHFQHLREAVGSKTPILYVEGNHEMRLQKYLWANPEMSSLKKINTVPALLGLDEFDIKYVKNTMVHGVLVKHGNIVRSHSAYTAKGEYDSEGTSGISGHCFSEDTEILTQRGWVKGFDLLASDKVMTMNKKTRRSEWNKINSFHSFDSYKELFHITSPTVDLLVTDKHGLIFENEKGKLVEIEAKDMMNQPGKMRFFNSLEVRDTFGIISSRQEKRDLLARLLINIVTDGSFDDGAIRWHLKKQRKIDHLRELLISSGVEYSETKQKSGNTKFRISKKDSKSFIDIIGQKKQLGTWVFLFSPKTVLDEYSITDGCKNTSASNSYQISSHKETEIDLLQELFTAYSGYRATKNSHGSGWTLTVNTRSTTVLTKNNVSVEEYEGRVWCVNVNNGTLLVRRNGKVCVTLNTHRLSAFYHTDRSGAHAWYEMGHLCDLSQAEYMEGRVANWQQGFGVMLYNPERKTWKVEQVPIINNSFFADGKVYKWSKSTSYPDRVALG